MVDPVKRQTKFASVRPISPNTRHPMRALFGLVGKAWSFMTSRLPGQHFVINSSREIPEFLSQCSKDLAPLGQLDIKTFDVEGCFPSMPKQSISAAAKEIIKLFQHQGHTGVFVARRSNGRGGAWSHFKHSVFLPFHILQDVLEFSLHNAFVVLSNGSIRWQKLGIPMGDPLSPGMCIGATAFMEMKWLANQDNRTRAYFRAKRYMDDILLVRSLCSSWDAEQFLYSLKNELYDTPLTLLEGSPHIFLETHFSVQDNNVVLHRLKNDNEDMCKVWRYQHYHSAGRYQTKLSTLLSNLMKVQFYASDAMQLRVSAVAKLREYQRLKYPMGILRHVCGVVAFQTGIDDWKYMCQYL